nr:MULTISPECIES: RHS repeat-associated core domain-containing protein [unclassified Halomonas]
MPDNRLTQLNGTRYRYDGAGNLVERQQPNGERLTLGYDGANRLVHLIHASELGATREATYRYDGLGRRISKTVRNPNGTTATTYYGWDGDRIVREETENQRTTVVYEPGSFVPMLRIDDTEQGQVLSAYITDVLGTPMQLVTPNGQPRWLAEPDDWAAVKNQRAVRNVTQPIRFQGQWHDEESGLYYNSHRYYDPQQGRYISQDPIGLNGGTNLYGYVTNPISMVDPLGLSGGPYGLGGGPYSQSNRISRSVEQAEDAFSTRLTILKESITKAANYMNGLVRGSLSFGRNYLDMREANTIGGDKYFHCKANCEAAQGGNGGGSAAKCISDTREWFDQHIKGNSVSSSEDDQVANHHGRNNGAANSTEDCSQICELFRPNGLPSQY